MRSVDELADAVKLGERGWVLHVSPGEYRAISEHMMSEPNGAHFDTWTREMRTALSERHDDWGWHRSTIPDIEVIIDFRVERA